MCSYTSFKLKLAIVRHACAHAHVKDAILCMLRIVRAPTYLRHWSLLGMLFPAMFSANTLILFEVLLHRSVSVLSIITVLTQLPLYRTISHTGWFRPLSHK